jgi:hypothetical protein
MGDEIQFSNKFGVKLSLLCPFFFGMLSIDTYCFMCTININVLEPSAFNLEF